MKPDKQVIGEAVRMEFEESTGKLFIVFEIKNEKQKQELIKTWVDDIEFKIIDKLLVKDE